MDRFQLYLAYTLLGVYVASCLAPWPGMSSVRQMQFGYALGCAGWLMLIQRVWRRPRSALRMTELLVVALALRLFLLAAPVSDDVHRYVWEGRVRLAGFNPYLLAPRSLLRSEFVNSVRMRKHGRLSHRSWAEAGFF